MDIYFTLWDITQYNFICFFFLAHFVPPLVIGSFLLWHVPLLFVGYFFLSYFMLYTLCTYLLYATTRYSRLTLYIFCPPVLVSVHFPRNPGLFVGEWYLDFPGGSAVKNPPAKQKMQDQSLSQEDPLEKEMATHSSILAWEIPWTEEAGEVQSMGKQKNWTWLSD